MISSAREDAKTVSVVRYSNIERGVCGTDAVAVEKPFRIIVDGAEYAAASILPGFEREFTYGFLLTSGLIKCANDVFQIELADDASAAFVELRESPSGDFSHQLAPLMPGTACGAEPQALTTAELKPLESGLKIGAYSIMSMVKTVRQDSPLFKETGAAHTAAIFDEGGGLLARADDVGRHNAVDKAAGFLLLHDAGEKAAVLVTTGRLTAEIAAKCWRLKIPFLASPSCATTRAIEIASFANLALIGFVRGSRMTIFSAPERIYAEEKQ